METIKTAKDLFKNDKSPTAKATETHLDELTNNFAVYQKRIELLSVRLFQSETLRRYIQVWSYQCDKFVYTNLSNSLENELRKFFDEFRGFIKQSMYDYFSNAFYRTSYDKLSELHSGIDSFRTRIKRIETDLDQINPTKIEGFKYAWENNLQGELNSLKRDAIDLEKKSTDIYEGIINELQQATLIN
ncbi:MAG TPA: hypothetical protein VGP55_03750 [Chitinophagaceae bacterium]|nr:hypothetical protein [Chitinophagaceae bacterium]